MACHTPIKLLGLIMLLVLSNCSKETSGTIIGKDELPKAALSYLADHLQPINPANLDGFEIWSMEQLEAYQFVFAGESHGMINNYDLDLAMIRHLNVIGWLERKRQVLFCRPIFKSAYGLFYKDSSALMPNYEFFTALGFSPYSSTKHLEKYARSLNPVS